MDFLKVEFFPSNRNVCFEFSECANNFDDFFYCFPDFCLRDEIIALDNDESSSNFKTGLKSVLKCKQKFVEFLTWFLKSLFSISGLVLNTQFERQIFLQKFNFDRSGDSTSLAQKIQILRKAKNSSKFVDIKAKNYRSHLNLTNFFRRIFKIPISHRFEIFI